MNIEQENKKKFDLTKELDFRRVDPKKALKKLREYINSLDTKEQSIYTDTKSLIDKYDEKYGISKK